MSDVSSHCVRVLYVYVTYTHPPHDDDESKRERKETAAAAACVVFSILFLLLLQLLVVVVRMSQRMSTTHTAAYAVSASATAVRRDIHPLSLVPHTI